MILLIWKSSGLINHLFFSSLFLLTPFSLNIGKISPFPCSLPGLRSRKSLRALLMAWSRIASRHAPAPLARRGSRQLRPPSLCCYFIHKKKPGCLVAHASVSLRHRLSLDFGRVSPPFHSGGTLPRLPCGRAHRLEQVLASKMFLKSHQCVNNSPLPLAERGGFFAARNHGCIVCLLAFNHGFPSRLGRRVQRASATGFLRTSDSHKPSDSFSPKKIMLSVCSLGFPRSHTATNIIFVPFCSGCVYHDTINLS